MNRYLSSLFVPLLLVGCGDPSPTSTSAPMRTESLGTMLSEEQYQLVADGVHEGPAIAVTDVLAKPEEFSGKDALRLSGEIVRLCKNKGCWLDVGTAEEVIHVTFARGCDKYMPLDSEGREVLIEGKLGPWEPSPEDVEHLKEDMGEEAAENGPTVVLSFVATGAALAK